MSVSRPIPIGNVYDKYSSAHPIEQRLMRGFLARLDAALPRSDPVRVLEVGVGEGEVARRIRRRYPDAFVAGLDLPDAGLSEQWRARRLLGVFGDIVAVPFPAQTFDLVLAIEVLEHVTDPDAALREIARVARGAVIVSVPREPLWRVANVARGKYWSSFGNTPGHINHWGLRAFRDLVGRHFTITAMHRPPPWTIAVGHVSPAE